MAIDLSVTFRCSQCGITLSPVRLSWTEHTLEGWMNGDLVELKVLAGINPGWKRFDDVDYCPACAVVPAEDA